MLKISEISRLNWFSFWKLYKWLILVLGYFPDFPRPSLVTCCEGTIFFSPYNIAAPILIKLALFLGISTLAQLQAYANCKGFDENNNSSIQSSENSVQFVNEISNSSRVSFILREGGDINM